MERKKHFRWDRLHECVLWAGIIVFSIWVVVSYCNVIMHNSDDCPVYKDWNFFKLMF